MRVCVPRAWAESLRMIRGCVPAHCARVFVCVCPVPGISLFCETRVYAPAHCLCVYLYVSLLNLFHHMFDGKTCALKGSTLDCTTYLPRLFNC